MLGNADVRMAGVVNTAKQQDVPRIKTVKCAVVKPTDTVTTKRPMCLQDGFTGVDCMNKKCKALFERWKVHGNGECMCSKIHWPAVRTLRTCQVTRVGCQVRLWR